MLNISDDNILLNIGVGSAFVHYENGKIVHEWQGQLRTHNSIFQAEVLGITAAVQHLIDCQIPRTNIYTDSLSTLVALENHHHVSPLILSLQHLLMQHPHYHLNLVWVKAHANNEGNEAADTLAKDAISNPTAQPITVLAPCSYLKGLLREQGMHQWQHSLRRKAVAAFRLSTEYDCILTYLLHRGISRDPLRPLCHSGEEMDRDHLLRCWALRGLTEDSRYWESRMLFRQ
ncbi:uncharacterized protein LOC118192425 [Stegodyphus dumicola]|uniref:uncharacterized protein LOC118192425 n=1 Tax=Stegodyphus dumicola TaxID=202533 RepID=UPI0015B34689|nr:uncharacterized protein LOC118192425 [Stegodyphus dumicola]